MAVLKASFTALKIIFAVASPYIQRNEMFLKAVLSRLNQKKNIKKPEVDIRGKEMISGY